MVGGGGRGHREKIMCKKTSEAALEIHVFHISDNKKGMCTTVVIVSAIIKVYVCYCCYCDCHNKIILQIKRLPLVVFLTLDQLLPSVCLQVSLLGKLTIPTRTKLQNVEVGRRFVPTHHTNCRVMALPN